MTVPPVIRKILEYPVALGCGTVLLVCGLWVFLRQPLIGEREDAHLEQERVWKQMEDNVSRAAGLAEELETARAYKLEIDERLLDKATVARNYGYFYAIERTTGVRVVTINQGAIPDARTRPAHWPDIQEFDQVPFTLVLEGSYNTLLAAIYAIERGSYLTRIDSWSVIQNDATTGAGAGAALTMRLEIAVLARKS
jgi:hypothetical protein